MGDVPIENSMGDVPIEVENAPVTGPCQRAWPG